MAIITKEQVKQLKLIKKKLSKLPMKERIKLLNNKGVKKLLNESAGKLGE